MRGTYRGEERASLKQIWKSQTIPDFNRSEVVPLTKFLLNRTNIVAIDIGANKGFWAKCLIDNFAVDHVYMVDASPENFHELRNEDDNLVFDDPGYFAKTSAYHYAMGSSRGFTTLYTNEDGSPLASLYAHKANGEDIFGGLDRAIRVPMHTLDDFLFDHREIRKVDILKMDVEGHELEVLRGAHGALANRRIDFISFEFGMHQVEPRHFFRDFYYLLNNAGYALHVIDHAGNVTDVPKYDYKYENFSTLFTYIAELKI